MKKILIIIAPFGFGPASKGLYIADFLHQFANLTMVTSGDAYDFVKHFAPGGASCLDGLIYKLFTRKQLAMFDLIISVNNEPAVKALIEAGFGESLVFVDSLLQWRGHADVVKGDASMLAYLIQDFPGANEHLQACEARRVELVAPIIWNDLPAESKTTHIGGVTLSFGGLTSPLIAWNSISQQIKKLILDIAEICSQRELDLTVIGNNALRELSSEMPGDVKIHGTVDPFIARGLLSGSELLLLTPGIGTIYEAMTFQTPLLVLAPTNSTQLFQFQVFQSKDIECVLRGNALLDNLYQVSHLPWRQHAAACLTWQSQYHDEIVKSINSFIRSTTGAECEAYTDRLLVNQRRFISGLSKRDIKATLLELIGN